MRTGYVSVKDKARQVAEIILDQMNLSTGEAISVPPGTFLENIDGLREDELLSILDKWQREGFLEYEQREAPSITMFGWSSAWTDTAFGERADDRLEQKPIGGNLNGDRFAWLIWCKPDREKLEKYLGEESKKPAQPRVNRKGLAVLKKEKYQKYRSREIGKKLLQKSVLVAFVFFGQTLTDVPMGDVILEKVRSQNQGNGKIGIGDFGGDKGACGSVGDRKHKVSL